MKKIKIKIRRFNPGDTESPGAYTQAYMVEVAEGMSVLEVLQKIVDDEDPTLAYRRSCRAAICGSCAMRINGFSKLACRTQIMEEYKKRGEILIEPLDNYPVLKDLVVDFNPFWRKINNITPFLIPPEDGTEHPAITKEDEKKIDSSQKCIMCGVCNSECNALEIDPKFAGPAALAKAWRFVGDVRDDMPKKRLFPLSEVHGMWDCVRCMHCTEYCPKDVSPLRQIEKLRAKAVKKGIHNNHGAKHVLAMADSVRRFGRLDEAAMTYKTLGFLRSLGMIPLGIKMEFHGKMPKPLLFAQIENLEEVKKIFDELEKKRDEEND
jgi:succinate dehydrogenase / fumarate reductase iron-sulfur subunit